MSFAGEAPTRRCLERLYREEGAGHRQGLVGPVLDNKDWPVRVDTSSKVMWAPGPQWLTSLTNAKLFTLKELI